jgi:homoserine dehydrogenase
VGTDPDAFKELGSMEFAKRLLIEAKIAVSPGSASANTARAMCASRWSRTSSESAKRRAMCAASWRYRQEFQSAGSREVSAALRVGLAGLGTVGAGVAKVLRGDTKHLAWRAGRGMEITAISARDRKRDRGIDLSAVRFESDPLALVERDDVDVVVEVMGGHEGAARALVEAALKAKKHVVTANKALLAYHGASLAAPAERNGVSLKFEAAICGGIPIVKALRESLIAYDISTLRGILNGTCNFILTKMEATKQPFADVLAEAQRLGYAEADPTLDIGGGDTAHKLTLLAALAFGTAPDLDGVAMTGIEKITPADIAFAGEFGFRLKLLGVAARHQTASSSAYILRW